MKSSFLDFLKEEMPEVLKNIENLLSDESNSKILKMLYEEQKGLPITKFIGVEKDGKIRPEAYNPTDIRPEKFTAPYISKKVGIEEGEVKKHLVKLSQSALVKVFPAKGGDYCTITDTAASYLKEAICHIDTNFTQVP